MTNIADTDLLIMHHLNDEDLYHLCLSNHYFLHLCRHDPILTERFEDYRYDSFHHPKYLLLLKGIHPETGRQLVKSGITYRGLLNKYKPIIG